MTFENILKYSNYFSGALLIGAEVYHVADREWMFYQVRPPTRDCFISLRFYSR